MSAKPPFLERNLQDFSQIFMTYYGIVQGLTLGYLLLVSIDSTIKLDFQRWTLVFTMFLVIYANWLQYAINTINFRWIPGIWDATIPMSAGLAELYSIHAAAYEPLSHWFFGFSIIGLLGWLAYSNFYRETKRFQENKSIMDSTKIYKWINYSICISGFFSGISMGTTLQQYSFLPFRNFISLNLFANIAVSLFAFTVIIFTIQSVVYWHSLKVHINYIEKRGNLLISKEEPVNTNKYADIFQKGVSSTKYIAADHSDEKTSKYSGIIKTLLLLAIALICVNAFMLKLISSLRKKKAV